jgi:hypothetical protein
MAICPGHVPEPSQAQVRAYFFSKLVLFIACPAGTRNVGIFLALTAPESQGIIEVNSLGYY